MGLLKLGCSITTREEGGKRQRQRPGAGVLKLRSGGSAGRRAGLAASACRRRSTAAVREDAARVSGLWNAGQCGWILKPITGLR